MHSLPNIHGDTFVTTDKNGSLTGYFDYDPFGNPLASTSPDNTSGGSYDWVSSFRKQSERGTLSTVQMGARVYMPALGRFLQPDPVEGGVENSYVYPPDPINDYDPSGNFSLGSLFTSVIKAIVRIFSPPPAPVKKTLPPPQATRVSVPARTAPVIVLASSQRGAQSSQPKTPSSAEMQAAKNKASGKPYDKKLYKSYEQTMKTNEKLNKLRNSRQLKDFKGPKGGGAPILFYLFLSPALYELMEKSLYGTYDGPMA